MTSKSIYGSFEPTYLYIKRHFITGKLYFGKTIFNPEKYLGSGKHWVRHIKKHGVEHVETLWYCLFLDQESLTEFALNFSRQENIVESEEWLNLEEENGIDGSTPGTKRSDEFKRRRSELMSKETGLNPFQNKEFIERNAKRSSERQHKLLKSGSHPFTTDEFRMKQSSRAKIINESKSKRENVQTLKKIITDMNISLGRGWHNRSDEWIDSKIHDLSI